MPSTIDLLWEAIEAAKEAGKKPGSGPFPDGLWIARDLKGRKGTYLYVTEPTWSGDMGWWNGPDACRIGDSLRLGLSPGQCVYLVPEARAAEPADEEPAAPAPPTLADLPCEFGTDENDGSRLCEWPGVSDVPPFIQLIQPVECFVWDDTCAGCRVRKPPEPADEGENHATP